MPEATADRALRDATNETPPLRSIPLPDGAGYAALFRWGAAELGGSVEALAEAIGKSRAYASAVTAGHIQAPTADTVRRFCDALHVSSIECYAVSGFFARAEITAAAEAIATASQEEN